MVGTLKFAIPKEDGSTDNNPCDNSVQNILDRDLIPANYCDATGGGENLVVSQASPDSPDVMNPPQLAPGATQQLTITTASGGGAVLQTVPIKDVRLFVVGVGSDATGYLMVP
jgi:hypothetical protein